MVSVRSFFPVHAKTLMFGDDLPIHRESHGKKNIYEVLLVVTLSDRFVALVSPHDLVG